MMNTKVTLPKSGFLPILFWVLGKQPWRVIGLVIGLVMTLLFGLVFTVITDHFPEQMQTVHIPPLSLFDWTFICGAGVLTFDSLATLLIFSLSLKLMKAAFPILLLIAAIYLAAGFICWPVRLFFGWINGWIGNLPFIHFVNDALTTTPTLHPASVAAWTTDISLACIVLWSMVRIVVTLMLLPEAEDPNLRLALFVPILVRKAEKVRANGNRALAETYVEKARELYEGEEAKEKVRDALWDMVDPATKSALNIDDRVSCHL